MKNKKWTLLVTCFVIACSNSLSPEEATFFTDESLLSKFSSSCSNETISSSSEKTKAESANTTIHSSSSTIHTNYIPLNDSEYPYSGIPRIVIETNNHKAIKDRENEIPAKLQIWGKNAPISNIMQLTIRGRGNTSWENSPKKGYKIEFLQKESILEMPENKDWALISNFADKTLMKNHVVNRLSMALNVYYTPRSHFVELFLNGEYQGVYLITETIKKGKNRVQLSDEGSSYIAEIDNKFKENEIVVFSTKDSIPIRIHNPKNCPYICQQNFLSHIDSMETFMKHINANSTGIDYWISIKDYIRHFWIQEFTKNPDGGGYTSVYFSWNQGSSFKMGPIWDFDIAFGARAEKFISSTSNWYTIGSSWNKYFFRNTDFLDSVNTFWLENRTIFESTLDTIETYKALLQEPAKNNFKRWNILLSTESSFHNSAYSTYNEAVDSLAVWVRERFNWIDNEISTVGIKQL